MIETDGDVEEIGEDYIVFKPIGEHPVRLVTAGRIKMDIGQPRIVRARYDAGVLVRLEVFDLR